MGLSLRGTTSGAVDINAPAVAGDNTITLPGNNGSANQFYKNSGTAGIVTHSSMVEDSIGRIGIGTDNPSESLSLGGNMDFKQSSNLTTTVGYLNIAPNGSLILDTDTGHIEFRIASSERMRLDSSGRLGLGETTDIDGLFVIKGDSNAASIPSIRLKDGSDTRQAWITNASGDLILANGGDDDVPHCKLTMFDANILSFETANTERMRIDSPGRMLIGSGDNTLVGRGGVGALVQIASNSNSGALTIRRATDGTFGGYLGFGKARGTLASPVIVQDDDELGTISWGAYDGTDYSSYAASITAAVDGTPGADDTPGRLEFSTTAEAASSPTLRLRINNDGRIDLNAGYISFGSVGMKTRTAPNATGASIFTSTYGTNVSQTGFIHAVEIGTTNYIILACYKKDSSSGVATTLIANNGLTVLATNPGGTVTLTGWTNTNNVRMISVINQTQYA